jgi:hypothetical protein
MVAHYNSHYDQQFHSTNDNYIGQFASVTEMYNWGPPQQKLVVGGDAFIENRLSIGGTHSPDHPLDVTGDINLTGALRANGSTGTSGQVLTSTGGGAMSWTTVSGGSSFNGIIADYIEHDGDSDTYFGFPSDDTFTVTTGGTERLRIDSGGNVGIGTSSPAYPLDVTGNMNISSGLRANGSSGVSGQVLTSSGGGAMYWSTVSGTGLSPWTTSGNDVYRSSGNIGIGTTTPAYTLDVNGDIRTTSEDGFRGNGRNITGINITSERNQTIINFGQQSSLKQSVNGDPL